MFSVSFPRRHASPCRVLGLIEGRRYTAAELRSAFYGKAKVVHPDAGGDAADFRAVCEAYQTLRAEHDHSVTRQPHAANSGFYSGAHARWDSASAARQTQYWRAQYARHEARCGEGLGDDFARDSGWDYAHARWRSAQEPCRATNFSSWHFYHPYVSSFDDPYGHGFTAAELRQAARRNRRVLLRAALKYALLLGGVLVVMLQYHRADRVRRAVVARTGGYRDAAYWAAVREYEAAHSPPRLVSHWLDASPPSQGHVTIDTASQSRRPLTLTDAASLAPLPPRCRQGVRGGGANGGTPVQRSVSTAGPAVVRFQGRPFTPTGVRGGRGTVAKTAATYAADVTHDIDLDGDDEGVQ